LRRRRSGLAPIRIGVIARRACLCAVALLPAAATADPSEACRLERDLALALDACTDWIDSAPRAAEALGEALLLRANRHFQLGNDAEALGDLTRVIKVLPRNAAARFYRAMVRVHMGNDTRALADFDRALTLSPGWPQALEERGNARARQDDYRGAIADWRAALGRGRNDVQLNTVIGMALFRLREFDAAMNAYDAVLAINPRDSHTFINRGQVHEARGDFDRALAEYGRALELDYDLWSVRMRRKLAEAGLWDGPPEGPDSADFRAALATCVRSPDC